MTQCFWSTATTRTFICTSWSHTIGMFGQGIRRSYSAVDFEAMSEAACKSAWIYLKQSQTVSVEAAGSSGIPERKRAFTAAAIKILNPIKQIPQNPQSCCLLFPKYVLAKSNWETGMETERRKQNIRLFKCQRTLTLRSEEVESTHGWPSVNCFEPLARRHSWTKPHRALGVRMVRSWSILV